MSDYPGSAQVEAEAAEFERKMEGAVEAYHRLAKQTQNPVYAWLALCSRGWAHQNRRAKGLRAGDLQIPAWCADYFTDAAFDLTSLSSGYDIRLPPDAEDREELAAADAMKLVPFALGLTSRGSNAFGTFRTSQEDMQVFNRMEELREQGHSAATSLGEVAREFGEREGSVLRKRVTRGRRLRKGERPEEEKQTGGEGKT